MPQKPKNNQEDSKNTYKKRTHAPTRAGRIQRRLPEEVKESAMTNEPERKQIKTKSKKPFSFSFFKPQKERKKAGRKIRFFRMAAVVACVLLVTTTIALGVFLKQATRNDDLWLDLEQIPYRTATIIYYTDQQTGEVLEYTQLPCTQDKEYVSGEAIPQTVKDAFVAIEDKKFYKHRGVDLKRTLYAFANELKFLVSGSYIGGETGMKQGASTIDQQLVKNLTRDDGGSNMAGYLRKVREIYRSFKLDGKYDKDTILNAYLNTISFTDNTAGVQAEARKLFGKNVEELSIAEGASLAAITRNPTRYNPINNPEFHLERRNYVLYEMWQQGYIDENQYNEAIAEPLVLAQQTEKTQEDEITSYFTDALMDEVVEELVAQRGITREQATDLLYNGGLRIYATVVPEVQSNMEKVMEQAYLYPRPGIEQQVPKVDDEGNPVLDENDKQLSEEKYVYPQAAMVTLDYEGGVCAVVGGLGEKEISRGFNRAINGVRQVGSTMKPIAPYVVALENNKITWSTPFYDGVVRQIKDEKTGEMIDWPSNVNKIYSERDILVEEAFARSVNTVAVRVGDKAGNGAMYRFVKNDLGISTFTAKDKDSGPLVLGSSTYGITPLEMANSYAMFGNGGQVPTTHTFTKIENGFGGELLKKEYPLKQVIGQDTAFIMNRLLREVVVSGGTASGMAVPDEMDSVGKTGTTSDNRDHWFIGLTPYYVTASWYGYDDNYTLYVDNSQHPPTLAWRTVMLQSQQNLPYREFPTAEGVVQVDYCLVSGAKAGANCPRGTGYYKQDKQPEETCDLHSS